MLNRCFFPLLLLAIFVMTGCGPSAPTNVADGATEDEIAEYERLIQESEEADNQAAEEAKD